MKWKRTANLILVVVFSIAFAVVTLLDIIGPLHMNMSGNMNKPGALVSYSLLYFIFSFAIMWGLYVCLRKKPQLLFPLLIILGIVLIILETYMWGWIGSTPVTM